MSLVDFSGRWPVDQITRLFWKIVHGSLEQDKGKGLSYLVDHTHQVTVPPVGSCGMNMGIACRAKTHGSLNIAGACLEPIILWASVHLIHE